MSMMPAFYVIAFAAAISLTSGQTERQPCTNNECRVGFSCHPNLRVCYEDVKLTSKLHVWLGQGPFFCNRQPSDCELFGMDFDVTHVSGGNSNWCFNGEKVRCVVRDAPSLTRTPDNELRVISYNVFERAYYISLDGQRERTCRIPYVLASMHPDVDVITFQENFMGGCWPFAVSMRDLLSKVGFTHQTGIVQHSNKVANGGIFIASRWPIIEEDQLTFTSSLVLSWDYITAKGVSYAKIQKGSKIYHVMASHFQSGGGQEGVTTRRTQSLEWAEFVSKKNIPANEGVVYSGDFNADYWAGSEGQFYQIMDNLDAGMPTLYGSVNASSNPAVNDILKLKGLKGWGGWIDHVLYSKSHLVPRKAEVKILVPEEEKPFAVCWCEQCVNPIRWKYIYATNRDCPYQVKYIKSLSDHQAVLGIFNF